MSTQLSDMLLKGNVLQNDALAPGVKIGLINLTPELAKDFQARIPKRQRKLSAKLTERYITDLLASQWPFTADVIKFNTGGEMIDGQHRCAAVLETGMSFPTLVAFNLDPESIIPMDTGKPRRFEDLLNMEEHIENAGYVGTLTRRVLHWQRGNYGQENVARVIDPHFLGVTPSTEQLWTVYRAMKDELIESTRRGLSTSRYFRKSAGPAVFAFSWMLFGRIDLDLRESFFHQLVNGPTHTGPEQPIAQLRRQLVKRWDGERKPNAWQWQHYIFQTWNRIIQGETTSLRRPTAPVWNQVAQPIDPHAEVRGPGWTPLPNIVDLAAAEDA
jgi:hypothetical protein